MVRSRARLVRGELRNAEEISDSPCTRRSIKPSAMARPMDEFDI